MYLILIIIIFLLIFLKLLNKKENTQENNKTTNNTINNDIDYKNFYKPKRYVTTMNEMNFYRVLLEIAKELDYILFAQVSLYNIIKMKDNLDYSTHTKYFNKIAS